MKKILIIALTITTVNGMAQQIVPLFGDADIYISNSGHYYKDVDNDFDKFVGTWKWTENNSSFTIILKKITNMYDEEANFYEDFLMGEYQYIENGIEKVNTLADINDDSIDPYYHKITFGIILANHYLPQCLDCDTNEHRISMEIEHPNFPQITGTLIMRYKNEGGVEKIYLNILDGQGKFTLNEGDPTNIDIPLGDYVLIKQ
jgi:Family of unknown function (DUF6705)